MTRYEIIALNKRLFRKKLKSIHTNDTAVANQYLNIPQGHREFTITKRTIETVYE